MAYAGARADANNSYKVLYVYGPPTFNPNDLQFYGLYRYPLLRGTLGLQHIRKFPGLVNNFSSTWDLGLGATLALGWHVQ